MIEARFSQVPPPFQMRWLLPVGGVQPAITQEVMPEIPVVFSGGDPVMPGPGFKRVGAEIRYDISSLSRG